MTAEQTRQPSPDTTRLFCFRNADAGWMPVNHLIDMTARLLEAEICDLSQIQPGVLQRVGATLLAPPRGGSGGDIFLLRSPQELIRALAHPLWRDRRRFRAVWIIDSFWTETFPRPAKHLLSRFDLVACTRAGDLPDYEALAPGRAICLGWGADVLDMGSAAAERPLDILRVGRQPPEWDDDARIAAACAARGLRFHGRPPFPVSVQTQQRELMRDWYARAKFIIAHSNLAAPAPYTHRGRAYITARWTDALACGASVAGRQPEGDMALIDWPGATLETGVIDPEKNLDQIAEAVSAWTPEVAQRNHQMALERLDWRWRVLDLATRLDLHPAALDVDLDRLRQALGRDQASQSV
ncbi:hypothetical protein HOY34_04435 [Xinfangfangia sp. D13-10-4-6]|uniref:hypothetical protein n=1 Tax=Pseudogemmobacter hezensis TaxID=2737662 RepID=UPI001551E92D|nr:hypothetical protein [Pseudogemmobacter hezensis]NPD14446.1 hypothetical protein [Pseudogemmobacter hezensis]